MLHLSENHYRYISFISALVSQYLHLCVTRIGLHPPPQEEKFKFTIHKIQLSVDLIALL